MTALLDSQRWTSRVAWHPVVCVATFTSNVVSECIFSLNPALPVAILLHA